MLGDDAALPDALVPTAPTPPPSAGSAMVTSLQAQLNRFASARAGKYRLFPSDLDVSGNMDAATATRASQVLVYRDTLLLLEGKGAGIGADLGRDTTEAATFQGMDPASWATKNLPQIAATITGFANSRGLPAAEVMVLGYPMSTVALAAAGLGVVVLLLRGRR